jgi:hypothetical protein
MLYAGYRYKLQQQINHSSYTITKLIGGTLHTMSGSFTQYSKARQTMDIIILNTTAVDLMRLGHLQEAISNFRVALGELLRGRVDQHEYVDPANKVTSTFLSVRSVPLEESLSLVNSSSRQDQNAFSVFGRALVIDDAELVADFAIAGQNCTTAVVMYNMGLAHQLQGMQDLRSQQANFKKAMIFYQLATDVLERCTGTEDHVSGLVYLAVSNNMGHIFSHFCNTKEAHYCLTWLFTILQAMEIYDTDILGDEYLPFHLNVLILHGQDAVAAAAA